MLNFTKVDRNNPLKRGVMERIKDFNEVYTVFDKNKAEEQADRCIGCGDPYCHNKCPLHNVIPAWLKQTATNDLELAFNISNETSPFPEILGRICPQDVLCEGDCTLNDTHGAITIGAVETHISETGFEKGLKPKFAETKIGKKVAVIGSGPAGISIATFLLREGVDVDMYERAQKAGGLLTYGIPGFKLDKHRVQRRIDWLIEAGMNLYTECEIGKDKSFDELTNSYDAVFLGIGATKGKKPGIDGENNDNVYLAMEFLNAIQKRNFLEESDKHKDEKVDGFIDVKDKKVVVIGGGDTAMDCVRTSVREGAKSVKCLYRRDESNMPGSKKEVINSKEEGVEFVFNVSPKSIETDGVKLIKTQMSEADASGRQSVKEIDGSEYLEEADIVILALGFDQEVPSFLTDANLELDKWNGIKVNESYQTSNSKIYAGGDGVRGADLAVTAAADGKAAAKAIVESFK
ncbi:MAG: glutamate synthase subunit beta [Campylobacterota bacterium]|nr:glutamate synthase subunit beta [Campylobacterota bacterium]